MPVIERMTNHDESHIILYFHCPGCGYGHGYCIKGSNTPVWDWNGSFDKPTFSPSLLVRQQTPEQRCHMFVRDGIMEFLSDCHHHLKNQKIPMKEIA